MVALIRYLPIKAREYLGSISGHEPCKESGINFHAVVIDKLNKCGGQESVGDRNVRKWHHQRRI
jgi:hypothetical protein